MSLLYSLLLPSHLHVYTESADLRIWCLILNFRLTWPKSPFYARTNAEEPFFLPLPFFPLLLSLLNLHCIYLFHSFLLYFSTFTASFLCIVKCLISFRYLPMCVAVGRCWLANRGRKYNISKDTIFVLFLSFFFFFFKKEWMRRGWRSEGCQSEKEWREAKRKSLHF